MSCFVLFLIVTASHPTLTGCGGQIGLSDLDDGAVAELVEGDVADVASTRVLGGGGGGGGGEEGEGGLHY